uniref:Uncharacterized protein n=1 Tax=Panagrolaimus superbus TaxID=310955 RepID=A0A914YJL2_9BILA
MVSIFSAAYGKEIIQFDIQDVKAITSSVFTAVSTSVFFSTKATRDLANPRKTRTYTLVPEIPTWSMIQELTGRFLNFEIPESVHDVINDVPLIRNLPKRAVVQIAPKPFAHGAERYAFYVEMLQLDMK